MSLTAQSKKKNSEIPSEDSTRIRNLSEAKKPPDNPLSYCVVSNIPKDFHSADVRSFFSRFTEENRFDCFHYKHRPEIRPKRDETTSAAADSISKTYCCIIRLGESDVADLLRVYNAKHWVDRKGKYREKRVRLARLKLDSVEEQTFKKADLNSLPELLPPRLMPRGNVGTPTSYFLNLIQKCRFPQRLIGRLGLDFTRMYTNRRYGAVPLNYSKLEEKESGGDNYTTGHGHLIQDELRDEKEKEEEEEEEEEEVLFFPNIDY